MQTENRVYLSPLSVSLSFSIPAPVHYQCVTVSVCSGSGSPTNQIIRLQLISGAHLRQHAHVEVLDTEVSCVYCVSNRAIAQLLLN